MRCLIELCVIGVIVDGFWCFDLVLWFDFLVDLFTVVALFYD